LRDGRAAVGGIDEGLGKASGRRGGENLAGHKPHPIARTAPARDAGYSYIVIGESGNGARDMGGVEVRSDRGIAVYKVISSALPHIPRKVGMVVFNAAVNYRDDDVRVSSC